MVFPSRWPGRSAGGGAGRAGRAGGAPEDCVRAFMVAARPAPLLLAACDVRPAFSIRPPRPPFRLNTAAPEPVIRTPGEGAQIVSLITWKDSAARLLRRGEPVIDFRLDDEYEALRKTVEEFAHEEVAPVIGGYYERQEFPYPLVAKMARMGLYGLPFPEEYGGM